jgi:Na+/proline symporter
MMVGLVGMYFYNDKSISKVVSCFTSIPISIYWGFFLGIVLLFIGGGIYHMDKSSHDFVFERCFVDQKTKWPVFTNMVLGIVLVFAIWFTVLLAANDQWKLGVELVEAVITGFVVKFGIAALANSLDTKWQASSGSDQSVEGPK